MAIRGLQICLSHKGHLISGHQMALGLSTGLQVCPSHIKISTNASK